MITLTTDDLGTLSLRSDPFLVTQVQIGSPAVREVLRARALADGVFDDTRYRGARAVTLSVTLNEKACAADPTTIQGLLDVLLPYLNPRRRPVLTWSLPGSESDVRQLTVRGVSAPFSLTQAKHPTIVCSFVAADPDVTSPDLQELVMVPGGTDELGRAYDRAYDSSYPASPVVGEVLATNRGNAPAHWRGIIYGECDDPTVTINGIPITFTDLSLAAGGAVTIDTRDRTMFYLDDPTESRYGLSNFTEWAWDDLLLQPGANTVLFDPVSYVLGSWFDLQWYPTWEG